MHEKQAKSSKDKENQDYRKTLEFMRNEFISYKESAAREVILIQELKRAKEETLKKTKQEELSRSQNKTIERIQN